MTVQEIREDMSSAEFEEWMAYYRVLQEDREEEQKKDKEDAKYQQRQARYRQKNKEALARINRR